IVLEVTGFGQLEFGFFFIFACFLSDESSPPPARWKCGNPASLAGFPSPVGRVGNWFFEFSTLSTRRHFHGARSGSSERSDVGHCSLPPRFLRIDSPRISMRWALCTSRSRMLSARVGSPICSCHLATGSWLVKIIDRRW